MIVTQDQHALGLAEHLGDPSGTPKLHPLRAKVYVATPSVTRDIRLPSSDSIPTTGPMFWVLNDGPGDLDLLDEESELAGTVSSGEVALVVRLVLGIPTAPSEGGGSVPDAWAVEVTTL